jgi:hypothetical protein
MGSRSERGNSFRACRTGLHRADVSVAVKRLLTSGGFYCVHPRTYERRIVDLHLRVYESLAQPGVLDKDQLRHGRDIRTELVNSQETI